MRGSDVAAQRARATARTRAAGALVSFRGTMPEAKPYCYTPSEPRWFAICPADAPVCPKCGQKFHGLTVGEGWALKTCDRGRGGEHCGGRALIIGAGSVCVVVGITCEELGLIQEGGGSARRIVRELGALTEPRARVA
jgi:hypothetical protein